MIISSGGGTGVPKGSWRSFAAHPSQSLADATLPVGNAVVLRNHHEAVSTRKTIEADRITDLLLVEPQLFEFRRERQMKRFNSAGQAQRFLSAHDGVHALFHRRRVPAAHHRAARTQAYHVWAGITGAAAAA